MDRTDDIDAIRIAKPCPASWQDMSGDDRVRHCSLCNLNVYNLSELSRAEAGALMRAHEGRLCVRLYRREDGKVMTKDRPKGIEKMRRVVSGIAMASCTLLLIAGLSLFNALIPGKKKVDVSKYQPLKLLSKWAGPDSKKTNETVFVGSTW